MTDKIKPASADTVSKILSMGAAKEKKEQAKEKTYSASQVEDMLCCIIAGDRSRWDELHSAAVFPCDFRVVRASPSDPAIIIEVHNNAAQIVSESYAAGRLADYSAGCDGCHGFLQVSGLKCQQVIKVWMNRIWPSNLNQLPRAVGFKSDPDLVMTRLDFDPKPVASWDELQVKAPFFASMMSRISCNRNALIWRIGSLFCPESDRKQAVWMNGPADCGKSQFQWLVQQLVGHTGYAILGTTDWQNDFWKAPLVGKRAGVCQEAPTKFIRSDEFKSITGDDEHAINRKNKDIFHAKLEIVMFFFSNNQPEIPSDEALKRRIIHCPIEKFEGAMMPIDEVRRRLTEEMPWIVGFAKNQYATVGGGRVFVDTSSLDEAVDYFEAEYLDFLDRCFDYDEEAPKEGWVSLRDFTALMVHHDIRGGLKQARAKRTLDRRWPRAKMLRIRDGDSRRRVFVGLILRDRSKVVLGEKSAETVGGE
jgi:hypothetical protein